MATVDHTNVAHTLNAIARDAAAALALLDHSHDDTSGDPAAAVSALLRSIGLRADTALPSVGCPPLRGVSEWMDAA